MTAPPPADAPAAPAPRRPADLGAAGLRFGDWLTDDHCWFTARAVGDRVTRT